MQGRGRPPEFPTHLSVDDARLRVRALCEARTPGTQTIELDCALGRVLAHDVLAPHDVPQFANSAMDGYALRATDLEAQVARFRIAGRVLAGSTHAPQIGARECVRITTGAPMPPGADTVVMHERVRVEGDAIVIGEAERAGANVRPAGEDFCAGDCVVRAGDRLNAARLGVLASCGTALVEVARLPRVALFVTGDELVSPDQPLGFGQIHDSNRYSLGGLLRELGIEPEISAHIADDPSALRSALCEAGRDCDVIITSGGVSAGEADFLPALVAEIGRVDFWKVRMKPGMPVLCGEVGAALVFGLPGNPVSSIATFLTLVRPALLALQGARCIDAPAFNARVARAISKKHARTEFVRVRLESRDDGAYWATALPQQGSGMLRGVAEADALLVVDEDVRELAIGDVAKVMPLPGGDRW